MRNKKTPKILTLVLSENKILNETKNHNPPCKLNGRSLIAFQTVATVYFKYTRPQLTALKGATNQVENNAYDNHYFNRMKYGRIMQECHEQYTCIENFRTF